MAQNHYQWGTERTMVEKPQTKTGMYEISNLDHVNAKVDALVQKIESLNVSPPMSLLLWVSMQRKLSLGFLHMTCLLH